MAGYSQAAGDMSGVTATGEALVRRVLVWLNPSAGPERRETSPTALTRLFRQAGCWAEVLVPRSAEEVDRRARAIEGLDAIVAAGGDGTINRAAQVALALGRPLGVLPLGTRNHFAGALGLPTSVDEAVRVVAKGRIVAVDVGEVNGRVFLNNASLGIYPKIVRFRERDERRGWPRWTAFAWAILTVLRRHPLVDVTLRIDGESVRRRTPFVVVSNNLYDPGGPGLAARDSLRGARLGLYLLRSPTRSALLRLALDAVLGRVERNRDVETTAAEEIAIETRHRLAGVALDGEPLALETPLRCRIRPGALRVIVD
ncbi:MAG TPA: diacylglycerol kinase family protein [Gemmatimonadales bacterium]|nr:diacylglycerol kinase family protein [Gemmatimonadales bacterium]